MRKNMEMYKSDHYIQYHFLLILFHNEYSTAGILPRMQKSRNNCPHTNIVTSLNGSCLCICLTKNEGMFLGSYKNMREYCIVPSLNVFPDNCTADFDTVSLIMTAVRKHSIMSTRKESISPLWQITFICVSYWLYHCSRVNPLDKSERKHYVHFLCH